MKLVFAKVPLVLLQRTLVKIHNPQPVFRSLVCLILLGFRVSPERQLVVAANRDEYFARRTQVAQFWDDHPFIYAGRDLEQMGTWLGVTKTGRFAALANWTDHSVIPEGLKSRGNLVTRFLTGTKSAREYASSIDGDQFQGFNLVLFDGESLIYTSNRIATIQELCTGVHAITNTQLGDAWSRAVEGAEKLESIATQGTTDELIETLYDSGEGEFVPGPEKNDAPCFILGKQYGTRSTAALIISQSNVQFAERSYGPMGKPELNISHQFEINNSDIEPVHGFDR